MIGQTWAALIVHRLTNDKDREVVERACGEIDRSASSFLPNLQPGEAAIIETDFPIPMTIQIEPPSGASRPGEKLMPCPKSSWTLGMPSSTAGSEIALAEIRDSFHRVGTIFSPVNSTLLKRLFSAIHQGMDSDVTLLCEKIINDERRRGHGNLAKELAAIVAAQKQAGKPMLPTQTLSQLPTSRRESAPLVQNIPHEKLRHHMVLPTDVEARFMRVEKEYAARERLANFGLRPRNRILLHGPPGCGKSLGAERLAWATGLSLQKVRFDTLLSSYFGETATNLRKIFDAATDRPIALFLDECDTIARVRGDRNDVGEMSRIVNMLLQLLEDFHGQGLVIAATNLDEALDPAIFRRFDEVLEVPKPGATETVRLLKLSFSTLATEPDFPWQEASVAMENRSCSEIVKVCQNAAKRSVLASRERVTWKDFEGAMAEQRRVA